MVVNIVVAFDYEEKEYRFIGLDGNGVDVIHGSFKMVMDFLADAYKITRGFYFAGRYHKENIDMEIPMGDTNIGAKTATREFIERIFNECDSMFVLNKVYGL